MENGGPAFPTLNDYDGRWGMSLRDYFAAAALTGYLSNPHREIASYEQDAEDSYKSADAMLAQRSKQS